MAAQLEVSSFKGRRVVVLMATITALVLLCLAFRAQAASLFWTFVEALLLGPAQ